MGLDDKIGNAAKDAVGNAKEGLGKVTDNGQLQAEGERDQAVASAEKAGEHLKDAGREVFDK